MPGNQYEAFPNKSHALCRQGATRARHRAELQRLLECSGPLGHGAAVCPCAGGWGQGDGRESAGHRWLLRERNGAAGLGRRGQALRCGQKVMDIKRRRGMVAGSEGCGVH